MDLVLSLNISSLLIFVLITQIVTKRGNQGFLFACLFVREILMLMEPTIYVL